MTKQESRLTPQQQYFLELYLSPKSETFGNALQSALKAGYAEDYANNITVEMPEWLQENLGKHQRMLMKAEKVLEDTLDSRDKKLAQDTGKFIAKTLGKQHYSEKTEVEHSGEIKIETVNYADTRE